MKSVIGAALFSIMFAGSAFAADPSIEAIEKQFTPPLIPHPVTAYLPITPEKNMCLLCHKVPAPGQKAVKTPGAPTALPPSHVTGDKVNPNRYECMLCHAPINKP